MFADVDVGFREIFRKKLIKSGVVDFQFLASVAPVVFAVGVRHFCVDIEPILHSFGKILLLVCDAVGTVQLPACLRLLIEILQAFVEGGVHLNDADAVDGM